MKIYGKYRRKVSWTVKNMEIMEEKLVEEWKDLENTEENCEMRWKIWSKSKLNSDKIWKVWKKISLIVKWFGKYRRKLWNDGENMAEK